MRLGDKILHENWKFVEMLIERMSVDDIQALLDQAAPTASLGDRGVLATALIIARGALNK